MVGVLICGGGNGAHVMSAILSSKPDVKVNVLTVYQNEAEVWSGLMKEDNNNTLTVKLNHGTKESPSYIKANPCLVTRDPAVASHDCDIIILAVPSFAHRVFLKLLKPYIREGCVLIGCPGHAGFEYEVGDILGDILKGITLLSVESLPWACRVTEYGKSAEVLATKATLIGAMQAVDQGVVSKITDPVTCFQNLLGSSPKLEMTGTFLGLTLKGLNACIHPSIMYGYWGKKWNGKPLEEPPLFYNGLDQVAADVLSAVSEECVFIAKEIMKKRPEVNLRSVEPIFDWVIRTYKDDVTDKASLFTAIKTNKAYQDLRHPCTKTEVGQFVPDFTHRYLSEDIPYGLVVVKGVAQIVGLETPIMDDVINWAQACLGLDFLIDGHLCGKDVHLSRAPQVYGITSLDGLVSSNF